MFQLQAPYPRLTTTTYLPNPQFGNQESLLDTLVTKRALDGTRFTYVKRRGGRRKLRWQFQLSRNKALELRAFFCSYFAVTVKITDHEGRVWVGNFTGNPFEFDTPDAARPAIAPMPRGELQAIDVEFEGVEL